MIDLLAQERREAAVDPRILFAAERTLLAWIRTGLALMGLGFVVARFSWFLKMASFGTVAQIPERLSGLSRTLGVALVVLGVALNVLAAVQHTATMRRLARGEVLAARPSLLGIALALLLAAIGLVMIVFLAL